MLREVHYFRSYELNDIPIEALQFHEREDTFRIYCINLNNTKEWYGSYYFSLDAFIIICRYLLIINRIIYISN